MNADKKRLAEIDNELLTLKSTSGTSIKHIVSDTMNADKIRLEVIDKELAALRSNNGNTNIKHIIIRRIGGE